MALQARHCSRDFASASDYLDDDWVNLNNTRFLGGETRSTRSRQARDDSADDILFGTTSASMSTVESIEDTTSPAIVSDDEDSGWVDELYQRNGSTRRPTRHRASSETNSTGARSVSPIAEHQEQEGIVLGTSVTIFGSSKHSGKIGTFVKFTEKRVCVQLDVGSRYFAFKNVRTADGQAVVPPQDRMARMTTVVGHENNSVATNDSRPPVQARVRIVGATHRNKTGIVIKNTEHRVCVQLEPEMIQRYFAPKNVQVLATPSNEESTREHTGNTSTIRAAVPPHDRIARTTTAAAQDESNSAATNDSRPPVQARVRIVGVTHRNKTGVVIKNTEHRVCVQLEPEMIQRYFAPKNVQILAPPSSEESTREDTGNMSTSSRRSSSPSTTAPQPHARRSTLSTTLAPRITISSRQPRSVLSSNQNHHFQLEPTSRRPVVITNETRTRNRPSSSTSSATPPVAVIEEAQTSRSIRPLTASATRTTPPSIDAPRVPSSSPNNRFDAGPPAQRRQQSFRRIPVTMSAERVSPPTFAQSNLTRDILAAQGGFSTFQQHAFMARSQDRARIVADRERRIQELPVAVIDDPTKLPHNHRSCAVCLCTYSAGDERRMLPCFHGFHRSSVDQWLRRSTQCPTCRQHI